MGAFILPVFGIHDDNRDGVTDISYEFRKKCKHLNKTGLITLLKAKHTVIRTVPDWPEQLTETMGQRIFMGYEVFLPIQVSIRQPNASA